MTKTKARNNDKLYIFKDNEQRRKSVGKETDRAFPSKRSLKEGLSNSWQGRGLVLVDGEGVHDGPTVIVG